MKIAVIGHTGMGGQAIAETLVGRGHEIPGISAHAEKMPSRKGLNSVSIDVFDGPALVDALRGQDVVISAFAAGHTFESEIFYRQVEGTRRIIKAFREAEAGYLLYLGGVASLNVKPGVQLFDDDRFPQWYFGTAPASFLRFLADITHVELFRESAVRRERGELDADEVDTLVAEFVGDWPGNPLIEGCRLALDLFAGRSDFTWSFLSPPWLYHPGKGSGTYHLGLDYVPFNDGRPAGIALPDLALAVADVVEKRAFIHQHWTVSGPLTDS